ncbi:zinc finger protein 277 isoform X4 [Eptesicus fuscus]|uniref:zinc finger protein 277 isoform X4 n=1 Tax=Eptesicus fuscus TaxID=29078 RepID=UPI002403F3ED|nr:zinc finger protein 277 isoform X4 [Eptesicus fuscus]
MKPSPPRSKTAVFCALCALSGARSVLQVGAPASSTAVTSGLSWGLLCRLESSLNTSSSGSAQTSKHPVASLSSSAAPSFLKGILEQQQRERNDNSFHGICMFCNEEFLGNRSVLLNHMAREHAFNIGLPDNIVNCGEFLSTLQRKLDNLQCLYCERTFRDRSLLKDHMRKKQHRRINPRNREYDQFYVINYLELGKSWEEVQSEDDRELLEHQEEDWSDWEERPVSAVCLFCEKQAETTEQLCAHMEEAHGFDLLKTKAELGLNFYEQVKLVNFIRRQVHQGRCYGCCARFPSRADLGAHLAEANHAALLPDRRTWDQPEYYFPTYENDGLLCTLSDSEGDLSAPGQSRGVTVIGEDTSQLQALRQSSVLNRLLPRGWEG